MAVSLAACSTTDSQSSVITSSASSVLLEPDEPVNTATPYPEEDVGSVSSTFDIKEIPAYNGDPYVEVNDNLPFFTDEDMTTKAFETYSDLDDLGRCGVAYANLCQELMPTEDRESISSVKPSGWVNNSYPFVDSGYLYNRCHLIGFQLAGENANEENLITGTRYMNVEGMLPFENMVADYIKETDNHVLYRVTPVFEGNNLLASGVLMEAKSVEDNGEGIQFCVYCYNVQDGVDIDYSTGENMASSNAEETSTASDVKEDESSNANETESVETHSYVLNTNSKKIHLPTCSSVEKMSDNNRQDVEANIEELIAQGYSPCGICNPQ